MLNEVKSRSAGKKYLFINTKMGVQNEKEIYLAIKEDFILLRAQIFAKRDSIASLSPASRKEAIEVAKSKILFQLNEVEQQVLGRLTEEQKNAKKLQRMEIENKRKEIKRHLEEIRLRIKDGVN